MVCALCSAIVLGIPDPITVTLPRCGPDVGPMCPCALWGIAM